jgi:hypothetical protein
MPGRPQRLFDQPYLMSDDAGSRGSTDGTGSADFVGRQRQSGGPRGECDRPPQKWSTLSYGFCSRGGPDAEEDLQAGRDCRQAASG